MLIGKNKRMKFYGIYQLLQKTLSISTPLTEILPKLCFCFFSFF